MAKAKLYAYDRAELKVGFVLRLIREARNLSVQDVSKKSGLSALSISRIERNESNGSLESFKKLCETYGISLEDIIFWTTSEPAEDVDRAKDMLYDLLIDSLAKRIEDELETDQSGNNESVPAAEALEIVGSDLSSQE